MPLSFNLHKQRIIIMARTSNDDRSDSMNQNNDAYHYAQDNHSDQLNQNNERYQGDESDDE